jgi:HK97 family phage major capsid protein
VKEILAQLNTTFEEFKVENDKRLKQIEARGHADPLLEGKVDKMNVAITDMEKAIKARIDEAEAKFNRLGKGGGQTEEEIAHAEHKTAFKAFMRKGADSGLREMEIKNALSDGSEPDGGYAVPVELDRNISETLINMSAMRRLANVITAGIGYQKLFNVHGTASGWVGETTARPETATSTLVKLTPYFGEIYANPAATQNSLDDIFFDVEAWIASEVAKEFEKQESAFLTGNGTNKPKGLLAYATAATADATRAFGTIQHIATGQAAALATVTATVSPFDQFIDMTSALKAGYRNGAKWLMNKSTLGAIRKIKTTLEGEYIFTLPTAATPGTILGYAYEEDENMPDIGADALAVAFGNFKAAYTIVDVVGTRVLRDPYTNKPYIMFYTTKRVGGFLENSEAVKVLKVASS